MIGQIALMLIHAGLWSNQLLYIGPGMDGSTVSLVIAFLISFFSFLVAIIWYPIKKVIAFFKRIFGKQTPHPPAKTDTIGGNLPAKDKA